MESNEEEKVPVINTFNPIVYLYNTHPTETYLGDSISTIGFVPNVTLTDFIIKEELENNNIQVVVENAKTSDVLDENNWPYSYSYKASRIFLDNIIKEYPSLIYFIDLHRDSIPKNLSTVTINDKSYAKILFIIGLVNKDHNLNEVMTNSLNDYFNNNYPGLSRGIYYKEGKGVNGIYNQDFNKNTILIEIGGEENTLEEVYNTCSAISKALINYIGEKN